MIDADKILKALHTDPAQALRELASRAGANASDLAGRLKSEPALRQAAAVGAGGALVGLIAGASAPRFSGAVARLGGVAALGGLAYYAFRRHEAQRAGAPPPVEDLRAPPPGFLPAPGTPDSERLAKLTLKAMINAAKADGRIDAEEKARLFDRLGQVSLTEAERAFLFAELARPMDTEGLVREAATPQLAAHIYAASLLAVDAEGDAEKAYLRDLAARLGLDPNLAAEIREAA